MAPVGNRVPLALWMSLHIPRQGKGSIPRRVLVPRLLTTHLFTSSARGALRLVRGLEKKQRARTGPWLPLCWDKEHPAPPSVQSPTAVSTQTWAHPAQPGTSLRAHGVVGPPAGPIVLLPSPSHPDRLTTVGVAGCGRTGGAFSLLLSLRSSIQALPGPHKPTAGLFLLSRPWVQPP